MHRHHLADKGFYSQNYGFSSSQVCMWELADAFKLWYWRRLKSFLDCMEIKPVNPKGNHPWIFIGRTDADAPILWPPDVKDWLIWKDPDAGKDWRQEMMTWLDGITNKMDLSLSKFQETVKHSKALCAAVHRVTKSQTWLSNSTELNLTDGTRCHDLSFLNIEF